VHTFVTLGEQTINYIKDLYHNENMLSFIFKMLVGVMVTILGFLNTFHAAWIIFMLADFATGMAKSKKLKQWNSKKGTEGYQKRAAQLVLIALALVVDIILNRHGKVISVSFGFITYFVGTDFISIIENLEPFGIKSERLKKLLEKYFFDSLKK